MKNSLVRSNSYNIQSKVCL
uniref:Uncharacterized protein n=1 Tax=Rhizophora mucronata TaxID=61149 RepID=A0A2P2NLW8_RHIMU